jgi:hypothetical protein
MEVDCKENETGKREEHVDPKVTVPIENGEQRIKRLGGDIKVSA